MFWEGDAGAVDELEGNSFNKAEHNRSLQELVGRSRGSIEFKHQNISAVLLGLGQPWIEGYKPASNFQNALVDGDFVGSTFGLTGSCLSHQPTSLRG